jgi:hypothetical protein
MDRDVIQRNGDFVVNLHKWVESDKDPAGCAAAGIAATAAVSFNNTL